jgi:hypothetical protein
VGIWTKKCEEVTVAEIKLNNSGLHDLCGAIALVGTFVG